MSSVSIPRLLHAHSLNQFILVHLAPIMAVGTATLAGTVDGKAAVVIAIVATAGIATTGGTMAHVATVTGTSKPR